MTHAASVVLPGVPFSFAERPKQKSVLKNLLSLLTVLPRNVQQIAVPVVRQTEHPKQLLSGDWLPARVIVPSGYGWRMVPREKRGRGMPTMFTWIPYSDPYCTHALLPGVSVGTKACGGYIEVDLHDAYRIEFADDGTHVVLRDLCDRIRAEISFDGVTPVLLVLPRFSISVTIDTELRLIQTHTVDGELGELRALQETYEPDLPLTVRAIREAAHAVRMLEKQYPHWRDVRKYWRGSEDALMSLPAMDELPVPACLAAAR